MQDADALCPGLLADLDEFVAGALRPGRHHAAVGMPDGTETLPVSGVAPDRPVLQQGSDQAVVFDLGLASGHAGVPSEYVRVISETYPYLARLPRHVRSEISGG